MIGRDGPDVFFPSGVTGGRIASFFYQGEREGDGEGERKKQSFSLSDPVDFRYFTAMRDLVDHSGTASC